MGSLDHVVLTSSSRLRAVAHAHRVLPVTPVPLDAVARMAARMLAAPMAVVSLVGAQEEEFLGMFGLPPRLAAARRSCGEHLACAYVVSADATTAVTDMAADDAFAGHWLVTECGVRSFVGVPLRDEHDQLVGAVTVLDTTPRVWTDDDLFLLTQITEMLAPIPAGDDPAAALTVLNHIHQDSDDPQTPDAGVPSNVSAALHADVQRGFITALLDSLQVGVFAVDTRRRPVLFNRTLRDFYGLPEGLAPAQALAGAFQQLHHLDGRLYTADELTAVRALQEGSVRDAMAVLRSPGRPDRYLLVNAEPIRDRGGALLGAVATAHDVTARRRSERFRDCELQVARILSTCDTIAQAAPQVLHAVGQALDWQQVALLLVDEVADVLRLSACWNAPGINACGLIPETVGRGDAGPGRVWDTGQPLWLPDLSDPGIAVTAETRAYAHAAAQQGLHAGMTVPVRDGDTVLGVLVALGASGDCDEFLTTGLLDRIATQLGLFLTRRHSDELSLALSHAKDDFLSLVGHEMRTPLTSIISYAGALADELDDPDLQQMLQAITRNTSNLKHITDDLLDLAGLESGHLPLRPCPVDLTAIVTTALTAASAPDGLHLHTDLPPHLVLTADPDRLRQIIDHLLSNAIKYSPDGGDIHITAHDHDDGIVELAVTDHGIGIPDADRDQLFTRLHRGSNARHTAIAGTGLGLALVHTLVHAHHGTVTHDPGHHPGTRIVVRLPQHPTG